MPPHSNLPHRCPLRAVTIPKILSATFQGNPRVPQNPLRPRCTGRAARGGYIEGQHEPERTERGLTMSVSCVGSWKLDVERRTFSHYPDHRRTHPGPLFYEFLAPPAPQPQQEPLLPRAARRHGRARTSGPCVSVCICGSILPFVPLRGFTKRTHRPTPSAPPCLYGSILPSCRFVDSTGFTKRTHHAAPNGGLKDGLPALSAPPATTAPSAADPTVSGAGTSRARAGG